MSALQTKQSATGSEPPVQETKLPAQGNTPVKKRSPVRDAKSPTRGKPPVNKRSPARPSPDAPEDPELPAIPPGTPVEDPAQYREGGLHPVDLGDGLGPNGRYRVFYKLGHDDVSTRWLCMDQWTDTAVSVRILAASASTSTTTEQDASPPATDENLFWLTGPNGRHRCRVGTLPGTSLASLLRRRDGGVRPNAAARRDWCRQLATGVCARHAAGASSRGPGDNDDDDDDDAVVLHLLGPELAYQRLDATRLTAPALTALLGTPRLVRLRAFVKPAAAAAARADRGAPRPARTPHYLVVAVDLAPLGARYGTGRLALRRRPLAAPTTTTTTTVGEGAAAPGTSPPHHAPPERLCGVAGFALAGDVWGLASVLFLVRTGTPLLGEGPAEARDAVRWLRKAFGPFPPALRDDVAAFLGGNDAGGDAYDDEEPEAGLATKAEGFRLLRELLLRGRHRRSVMREEESGGEGEAVERSEHGDGDVGVGVGRKRKADNPAEDGEPSAQRSKKKQKVMAAGERVRMKESEADLLADLLASMLLNDPWDRISVDQVLAHTWFEYGTKKPTEKK